jgi:IS30 family transposase
MRHYTQLTIEQRYQISGLKKSGFNQSRIAADLNSSFVVVRRVLKVTQLAHLTYVQVSRCCGRNISSSPTLPLFSHPAIPSHFPC